MARSGELCLAAASIFALALLGTPQAAAFSHQHAQHADLLGQRSVLAMRRLAPATATATASRLVHISRRRCYWGRPLGATRLFGSQGESVESGSGEGSKDSPFGSPGQALRTFAALAASGAVLGPNLDNFHSAYGVLQYAHPIVVQAPWSQAAPLLTTAVFTPPLFALAAILIGGLVLGLDHWLASWRGVELGSPPGIRENPSGARVLACIAYFVFQYWLSGYLSGGPVRGGLDLTLPATHAALAVSSALAFFVFDTSAAALAVGALTAVGGPLIELALINQFHLYEYIRADFYGIDSWIPWVYAAGAPAVGNLARYYKNSFGEGRPR